jgi:hypothetical protein
MDWLALLLKLGHVAAAFVLVAGLAGRWVLLTQASRSTDIERQHLLADAASPFERAAQFGSMAVVGLGLLTAWAQDYPWLGLTTPWILLTVVILVPMIIFVPAILIPRGRAFDAAMADARTKGIITPALRAAWSDRAVAFARRYELVGTALIVALMVIKPF